MPTDQIVETGTNQPASHVTIIRDSGDESRRGYGLWVALLGILVLGAVAFFAFGQLGGAEIAKDNAMADAANAVGNAADDVGAAAGNASAAVEEGVDSLTQ